MAEYFLIVEELNCINYTVVGITEIHGIKSSPQRCGSEECTYAPLRCIAYCYQLLSVSSRGEYQLQRFPSKMNYH